MMLRPPVTIVVHDSWVEMRFVARNMIPKGSLPAPGPYEEFGACIQLRGTSEDWDRQQERAISTLLKCARATIAVLETGDYSRLAEGQQLAPNQTAGTRSWITSEDT